LLIAALSSACDERVHQPSAAAAALLRVSKEKRAAAAEVIAQECGHQELAFLLS